MTSLIKEKCLLCGYSGFNGSLTEMKYCFICGEERDEFLIKHHVHPKALNGTDDIKNLAVLCNRCHRIVHSTPNTKTSHSALIKHRIMIKRKLVAEGKDVWKGRGIDRKMRKRPEKRGKPII